MATIELKRAKFYWNEPKKRQQSTSTAWSEDTKFYHSKIWSKLRKKILGEQPLCIYCLSEGIYTAVSPVDHIVPHRFDGSLTDKSNLQPLCNSRHNRKSSYEAKRLVDKNQKGCMG